MPFWNCVNKFGYYCASEPDWEIKPVEKQTVDPRTQEVVNTGAFSGGTCKSCPAECGKLKTYIEVFKPSDNIQNNCIQNPSQSLVLNNANAQTAQNKDNKKKSKKPAPQDPIQFSFLQ